MIIDCHGHYTTAPSQLDDYRKLQIAACTCGESTRSILPPVISDDAVASPSPMRAKRSAASRSCRSTSGKVWGKKRAVS